MEAAADATTSGNRARSSSFWHVLGVLHYLLRKGMASKRKLTNDINLFLKRGKKAALGTLVFLHQTKKPHSLPPIEARQRDEVQKAFEILNSADADRDFDRRFPTTPLVWRLGRSPAVVRQLRITDSPFPLKEEEEGEEEGGGVDVEAEEFIVRFYQQLRLQQRMDYGFGDFDV